ncbi:hypothetical protein VitviT2T_028809 [Vitis vinifera]|uniref:Uncharacterized protein n=1 Tax=Vitis vinifera TaxID=29760 RepID=A0ABY9DXY7_VITVI|nr:hypothetical protein VitviT2T_028809 [Vitis vinifera]
MIAEVLSTCVRLILKVIGNVEEKLSQEVHDIQEEVKDAYTKTKEKVSEKTHMVQEGVKDAVERAKHAAKPTCDLSKTIVEDVAGNISKIEAASRAQMGQRGRGERQGEEKDGVDTVKSTLHEFQKKGQHDFINRIIDVCDSYFRICHSFWGHALLATLLIILINLLYLEPRATKVMFERIRVENEERKGQESSRVEPGKEGEPTTGASDPQVMGRLDQETVNNKSLN